METAFVEIYVDDLKRSVQEWTDGFGFRQVATARCDAGGWASAALRQGRIGLVLTQGFLDEHPAQLYVSLHGTGVAHIALRTPDADAAHAASLAAGARPAPALDSLRGSRAGLCVAAFGDVVHSYVDDATARDVTGVAAALLHDDQTPEAAGPGLTRVDHFAVCLASSRLDAAVAFYRDALGFREIFQEFITVGPQAMRSRVVQSPSGLVTFTIIAPEPDAVPGQIDDFLKQHGGDGIQHVAFASDDAVSAVRTLTDRGVRFLRAPGSYYELLTQRVTPKSAPLPSCASGTC